ncbi:type I-U CRISPR-associated RAMP protein Csb1/Cas7u [Planctomycetes bacterium K23_9]
MNYKDLSVAVSGSACAFRGRTRLQPADGVGGKVFPPTHLNGAYAIEKRVVEGRDAPIDCVLLDSVQSHANRCEEALQLAIDREQIEMPLVEVDFSDADLINPVARITALEAPHRISDAILRDSELDGTAFRKSDLGRRMDYASLKNATPLLDLSPHSLLFGIWDSTGPRGGLGVKFQRSLVGEIIGYDISVGKKTASRIDPLQIVSAVPVKETKDNDWDLAKEKEKGAIKPSAINHGNIPPTIEEGGVTMAYAEHSVVISLPAIRRLRFPIDGEYTRERDQAGQSLVAAIGVLSVALATEQGFDLRSRCLLWPETKVTMDLLDQPGSDPKPFDLDSETAIAIYNDAVAAVQKAGLPWRTERVVLKPSQKLVKLVRASQEKATNDPEAVDA